MAINDPEVCAVLPKVKGKNSLPRMEFFTGDSRSSWEKHGGRSDNFKVRVGGRYVTRKGERHSFFTRDGLAWLLMHHLAEGLGIERPEIPAEGFTLTPPKISPGLPAGTKIIWINGDEQMNSITRSPIWHDDGEWFVMALGSTKPVPLAEIEIRH